MEKQTEEDAGETLEELRKFVEYHDYNLWYVRDYAHVLCHLLLKQNEEGARKTIEELKERSLRILLKKQNGEHQIHSLLMWILAILSHSLKSNDSSS